MGFDVTSYPGLTALRSSCSVIPVYQVPDGAFQGIQKSKQAKALLLFYLYPLTSLLLLIHLVAGNVKDGPTQKILLPRESELTYDVILPRI